VSFVVRRREGLDEQSIAWAFWSAVCGAALVYLGSGTAAHQARWPVAGAVGCAVGAAGGWVVSRLRPGRPGGLAFGLLFGIAQAVGVESILPP
jgi:hypothetical protein